MSYSGMQPLEGYRGLAIGLMVDGEASIIVISENPSTLDAVRQKLGSVSKQPPKKALLIVAKLEE